MGVVVNKSLAQAVKLTDFVEPVQMRLLEPPINPRVHIITGGANLKAQNIQMKKKFTCIESTGITESESGLELGSTEIEPTMASESSTERRD
ncbi:hypothetical protein U1Q18_039379 [Sarracenia purpurea var. burkii]